MTSTQATSQTLSASPALPHTTFPRHQRAPACSLAQQVFREKEQHAAFARIPRC
jgi:hypothetical protein